MSAARGALLALALDAVDPRLGDEQRATAASEAVEIDPLLAAAVWSAILHTLLGAVESSHGRAQLNALMHSITTMTMSLLDPDLPTAT